MPGLWHEQQFVWCVPGGFHLRRRRVSRQVALVLALVLLRLLLRRCLRHDVRGVGVPATDHEQGGLPPSTQLPHCIAHAQPGHGRGVPADRDRRLQLLCRGRRRDASLQLAMVDDDLLPGRRCLAPRDGHGIRQACRPPEEHDGEEPLRLLQPEGEGPEGASCEDGVFLLRVGPCDLHHHHGLRLLVRGTPATPRRQSRRRDDDHAGLRAAGLWAAEDVRHDEGRGAAHRGLREGPRGGRR
mmetsp:Transcript_90766/g.236620  ORF Transcript_90766/g.236620 Transcript_90766/m.236620 type:complete len:241 (-) Transcript_90766:3250-3972(-)